MTGPVSAGKMLRSTLVKNGVDGGARRGFIETYSNAVPSSSRAIQRLVKKFETTGTILEKKHSRT